MDFVDNRVDQFAGTMRGRAVFANPDGILVPGLFVRLRLIGETKPNAVLVPDEAIGADQSNRVVYVVDAKNTVALRTVVTGRLIEGLRVIQSGLDGYERIVVRGVQRVRPGSEVTPHTVGIEPATGTAPAATQTPTSESNPTPTHSRESDR
jgi:multidrug efflux system membrane fusion protein